jgi:hypothetical protein
MPGGRLADGLSVDVGDLGGDQGRCQGAGWRTGSASTWCAVIATYGGFCRDWLHKNSDFMRDGVALKWRLFSAE